MSQPNTNNATFPAISEQDARELVQDRIKFKLYTAEHHLNNLKYLEKSGGSMPSSFQSRVQWEMEIDHLLAQLIGAKDALLVLINDRLGLGLDIKEIDLGRITNRLNSINKGTLVANLNKLACQSGSWLWILNDLRNQSMHRGIINIKVHQHLHENINTHKSWDDRPKVCILQTELEVISYFEESTKNIKNLIEDIKNNEPLLR
jgi:hypothetical protein